MSFSATSSFNAIMWLDYFPNRWKIFHIVVVSKPGKPEHKLFSYRSTDLLPALSKIFEKLLLIRLTPVLIGSNIIPEH